MEGPLSQTATDFHLFLCVPAHTLENNEETDDSCMLNIPTLLFVAFKLAFFS